MTQIVTKNLDVLQILHECEYNPILMDVGAAGMPPKIWEAISSKSIYIGFDPDLREMRESYQKEYLHSYTIPKAVSPKGDKEVLFYLTESPYCSSTLQPNGKELSNYIFTDY